MNDVNFANQRAQMVERHISHRGIRSKPVLAAMRSVPREEFLPAEQREFAYEDTPLPIAEGQTISQPYIVAMMTDALELEGGENVLEIGTGSGYAAAVLSQIAKEVYTVERIGQLAEKAAATLSALGYRNVHVRHADGTLGWPEHEPYDAIVVAAGGPQVPESLKAQLKIGGRLVMPVGADRRLQELVRVTRLSQQDYKTEELADVRFVPLVGEEGWAAPQQRAVRPADGALAAAISRSSEKFASIDAAHLDPLLERIGDSRVVLIGEASHGTSEFYRMRARITRALIESKDFSFVAIEGDWPDAARIDNYVRHRKVPASDYLQSVDPKTAELARERYGCLTPWQSDPAVYGHATLTGQYHTCEGEVTSMPTDLLRKRGAYSEHDGERFMDAVQNARLVANAERYYRVMYYGSRASWNLRDTHMFETLKNLISHHGPHSKAIVWAHNSHVGDSAATEMSARDEYNIGHLCRQEFGNDCYSIGFGTHSGTVAAASNWDEPMEVKSVRASLAGSYERLCHETGDPRFFLPLRGLSASSQIAGLMQPKLERAIGVIYRPETELQSHYFEAVLPHQFDEYVWFDQTRAVTPLRSEELEGLPDTYPFGL
jgi:protein-L-isoaspartate(D-aspartate) O-methyltransferase